MKHLHSYMKPRIAPNFLKVRVAGCSWTIVPLALAQISGNLCIMRSATDDESHFHPGICILRAANLMVHVASRIYQGH